MKSDNNDPFTYRSQGGRLEIGSEKEDGTSAMVKVDDKLVCITRKNIREILMADDIDPERSNPKINHNIQNVLPYGSDNEFVGRTFQQASFLFEEHLLKSDVDSNKGLSISLSFLKEITSLHTIKSEYVNEEKKINSSVNRKGFVPTYPNLEQKVKGFILNTDHAIKSIIELVQLFYPDIKNKGWDNNLYEKIEVEIGEQDEFTKFISNFKDFTGMIRKIRNAIEHKDENNVLTIKNYKLTSENIVELPSISFKCKDYNLPETRVSTFMNLVVSNLLTIFESLMAHLCNLHAQEFAGDKRIVVFIPEDKRQESERFVNFKYEILWTK